MQTLATKPSLNPATFNPAANTNLANENKIQNQPDPKKYLEEQLRNEKIMQALNSSEGVPETQATNNELKTEVASPATANPAKQHSFIRDLAPIYGYSAACVLHILAGLSRISNLLPNSVGKFLDENAQKFSKLVNFLNYGGKSITAYKSNNSLDSISKGLLPAVIPWVSLENTFLAVGLISGTTMLSTAHHPRITNEKDFWGNLKQQWETYKQMGKELFTKEAWKKIRHNEDTHLMYLGGNMNLFGGLIGMALGAGNKTFKAMGSLIRNVGGAVCDIAKILHGDVNYLISGALYIIIHVLDIVQTVSNKERARTISHFVQGISSVANYFYTQPTNTMADHTFKDKYKDARLVPALRATVA